MTNLTPSEARRLIDKLHHNQTKEHGISILEEKYLAALEIALPVLEKQEGKSDVMLRESIPEIRSLTEESGCYSLEELLSEQDNRRWIDCRERMPDVYSPVLLVDEFGGMCIGTMQSPSSRSFRISQPDTDSFVATHWKWLPPEPQPTSAHQIENDGWIEWDGDCDSHYEPVVGAATVEVKFRNGKSCVDKARKFYWKHIGDSSDIIAYRVIENDGREG